MLRNTFGALRNSSSAQAMSNQDGGFRRRAYSISDAFGPMVSSDIFNRRLIVTESW
jgi:hypothetical protein